MRPMTFDKPTPRTCWFLENATASIAVEKATGFIRGCTWRKTGVDLFQQTRGGIPGYIGGLRPPRGSLGKLYTVKDGYIAGIINKNVDAGDAITYARTPYALFRVGQGHNVGRVEVMYPGDKVMRDVTFKFDGTFIAVPLPDYTNCAVVKLFITRKSRKAIGPDRFYQRDRMCGDPESAFEDISERGCDFTSLHRTEKSGVRSRESELISNNLRKQVLPEVVSWQMNSTGLHDNGHNPLACKF